MQSLLVALDVQFLVGCRIGTTPCPTLASLGLEVARENEVEWPGAASKETGNSLAARAGGGT